jgi:hypothetical protein
MSKEKKSSDDDSNSSLRNWTYDGSEEEWTSFDRWMQWHMRKRLGQFEESIWLGTVPKLLSMGPYEYERYCNDVWKAIDCEDAALARKLWNPAFGFFTYDWQVTWIERQCSLMVDFIEDHAKDRSQ